MALTFWISAALILVVAAGLLGKLTIKRGLLGVLIDDRGRYSLTQFQLVLWTIVVLSLICGVVAGRLVLGDGSALGFAIPNELLVVMGISMGSTAAAATIKASKDAANPERVAASNAEDRPRFSQILLREEGDLADQIVDITKFQNFWLTLLLVGSYVSLAISEIRAHASITDLQALPGFSGTLATLLGISHAGYLAGKLPNGKGTPQGLTLALKRAGAVASSPAARAATATAPTYLPRNPP